jgi:hypothetical protein
MVDAARTEMIRSTVGQFAAAGGLSVRTLRKLARTGRPDAVRLGAARALADFLFRGAEVDTVALQLAELRNQLEGITNGIGDAPEGGGEAASSADGPNISTVPDSGAAAGGPGQADVAGGADTGSVAAEGLAIDIFEDTPPLLPAGG